jgi:hypothetical protein
VIVRIASEAGLEYGFFMGLGGLGGAGGEARTVHALAQAALLEKILFEPANLLIDKVVGLVDQADNDVVAIPPTIRLSINHCQPAHRPLTEDTISWLRPTR